MESPACDGAGECWRHEDRNTGPFHGRKELDRMKKSLQNQKGATGWIMMWLLGIPIPLLLAFFVLRGCT